MTRTRESSPGNATWVSSPRSSPSSLVPLQVLILASLSPPASLPPNFFPLFQSIVRRAFLPGQWSRHGCSSRQRTPACLRLLFQQADRIGPQNLRRRSRHGRECVCEAPVDIDATSSSPLFIPAPSALAPSNQAVMRQGGGGGGGA